MMTVLRFRYKHSIVRIRNVEDELCLARALVVCKAKAEQDPIYGNLRKSCSRMQKEKALELHRKAKVSSSQPCNFNDLPMFETALNSQIIVYSATKGNKPIYVGEVSKE